jgi:putative acetyltransferase
MCTSIDRIDASAIWRIVEGGLADQRVIDLINIHVTTARSQTASGSAHAMQVGGLQSPDIAFWTIWDGDALLGFGALKRLSADHGEIKSMHTARAVRGRGVARAMLRHIIAVARQRRMARLSLETGSWDHFRPAHALYRSHGFVECPPFGDYGADQNSLFMTLELNDPTWPCGRR